MASYFVWVIAVLKEQWFSVVLFLIYKRVRTYTLRMFPYVYENCNLYSRYLGGGVSDVYRIHLILF